MSRIFKQVGTTVTYIDNSYKLTEKRGASTSPYDRHETTGYQTTAKIQRRQKINITKIIRVKTPLRETNKN